jgi:probable selenium-dependent hydroxylase accessory protein YqeC
VEQLSAWFEAELFHQKDTEAGNAAEGSFAGSSAPLVLTVIGSGGKTSLIWHLAQHLRGVSSVGRQPRRILVTPTTKMLVPEAAAGLYDHYCNGTPVIPGIPHKTEIGITLAGFFNEETGKLESLPIDELERIVPEYDLTLIEGDGSRGLPLKAWADHEPVVPLFTAITVGILPLWPLGMPVSETIVHRLPLFSLLSGAKEGDTIKPEHLVRVITGTPNARGLFAAAQGRKLLFLNQVEDDETLRSTRELVSLLGENFRAGLGGIIAGSVQKDIITCFSPKSIIRLT